jgi:Tfp pilus assembly PilM family ATPase
LVNGFISGVTGLFSSGLPEWSCEFSPRRIVAVQASSDRKEVISKAAVELPDGAIVPAIKGNNIQDSSAVESALGRVLDEARFSGSELIVVIPDDAVRITLLETESFPSSEAERQTFIRWKLKKHVPFDVSTSQAAYQRLGENGTVSVLAGLSPGAVTREYEGVLDRMGMHPGIVTPSTIAALNLCDLSTLTTDTLFVKLGDTSVITSILKDGKLRFYRKVPRSGSLESAIHPTMMYYQDKLGDDSTDSNRNLKLGEMILCVDDSNPSEANAAARQLGLVVRPLYSSRLEDIYKPSLGALQR